jgi:hypothetical protein
VKADIDELRRLLGVQRGRLEVALRIEDERSIVFPETSVIIRDIERLLDLIAEHEGRSRKVLRETASATTSPKPTKRRAWQSDE